MPQEHHQYIMNRMAELGHDQFSTECLVFETVAGYDMHEIHGYNEYLYLISDVVPGQILIQSDTQIYFNEMEQPAHFYPLEFKGYTLIEANSPDDHKLEFIRVIPG